MSVLRDIARDCTEHLAKGRGTDDRALLARLCSGDTAALRVLHERHAEAVYWTARETLDADDAEEVAQDAFVLLWRKCRGIELPGTSVLPWLLITARYLAVNLRRASSRNRAHTAELPEHPDDLTTGDNTADTALIELQLERVAATIATLPQADQDVYRLCLVEGRSYKQAAYELRVSHAAVRNRLARVRASLRKEIEP